ncbi:MAG: 1-deoxy-D-xylulose-5-phosphate reductoisomerase [Candidatus Nealsonbacteria bacterium CG_4_10_14_0_2_um_filter_38_17]|uniref:1-deoxy-D-xylulose 5-phosphate reductoisomerase n=2 Tax=Candidatus Nealsoniibacteriota TaxID=1817911 RepID=A0A2M7UZ98_9BACT|nr:MAG: 1-deoxy-D-xylulose-5-phosphate reductoisomerase [Candidatus Nealsonbacteria bacterium CG23_combo_of_CG06-09_8_20_14_all_38_19]PIZ89297.1 MAG: 1-deoxy-D-xylulose-5-phosphate reductoisomerase [Candidatus Nealsonbacteria bacterium CG_4_10_14_0_2_um_filter_38_17]
MENLVVLGSTGSIGRQAIEVLRKNPDYFKVFGLAAKDEIEILSSQIREFNPEIVSVADEKTRNELSKIFPSLKVYVGEKGLIELSTNPKVNSVVFSTSGIVCLRPLIEAIKNKKRLLVANKEIIITAGEIINKYINEYKTEFLPLDSEHSAIFQCLKGENNKEVKNLILTCSGGPFKYSSKKDLEKVTVKEVLSHPVWKMGPKITVDSASLLNKGFEVLEAHYIFRIPLEKIKVVIHPECIIHSMVEFQDGSIKALLSIPDMRLPIQYALFHPKRLSGFLEPLDLVKVKNLSFFEPDTEKFPCLKLAYEAGKIGKTMPAALVFADEIAVSKFLDNKIKFSEIPRIIEKILTSHRPILEPRLEDIFKVQNWVYKQFKD